MENSISAIEEKNILELELERRRTFEPLRFFSPNPAQKRFFEKIAEEKNTNIIFPAGNWVGKTAAAIAGLAACMWPAQAENKIFNFPIFKNWPYPKRARIISTPKELESIGSIQNEIKKWWPHGRYLAEKNSKSFYSQFKTDTGWIVDVMSYEQSAEEFEGASIGFFIFNEPPPENIFNACLARMKFGGKILIPMTPLMGAAWIFDRLISHDGENGIAVVYGSTEENCREHSENGVIPHSAIEDFKNSCDPDEAEARLHGKFLSLAGNIFKTFSRDIHVAKNPIEPLPPSDCLEHIQSVDPATGKPLFSLWGYFDNSGFLTIYREWPDFDFVAAKESNFTISDYVKIFRDNEKFQVRTRLLDRHFGNNRSWTGSTLKQDFDKMGFHFINSYACEEEVETGIMKVKEYLSYNRSLPISNLNHPGILISPTCKNLIKSLERWGRNPKTGKPNDDCWKDAVDCLRYICSYRPLPLSLAAGGALNSKFARSGGQSRSWDTSRPFD